MPVEHNSEDFFARLTTPPNQLDSVELKKVLGRVQELPEAQQEAILEALSGRTREESATELGVPTATLKSRLRLARAKLLAGTENYEKEEVGFD